MSLEAALAANTAAIEALTLAFAKISIATPAKTEAAKPAAEKKTEAKEPAAGKPEAAQTAAPASSPSTAPAADAQETKAVAYEDCSGPFLDLFKSKGRDAAVGVLKPYGVEKLSEVPADKFGEVLAAIQKAAE